MKAISFSPARLALPRILGTVATLAVALVFAAPDASASQWNAGDVFVGVGGGLYKVYDHDGNFKETLDTGFPGSETTGGAFDADFQHLYTTCFQDTKVVIFDGNDPHGITGSISSPPLGTHCESIVFDTAGNFYVGHADGDGSIKKFDSANNFLTSYPVTTGDRGSDWITLAADQQTMFYTSEDEVIRRYDVSTSTQLPDFAALAGVPYTFALRLLPPFDGSTGLIVAATYDIKRLDSGGNVVQAYDAPGEDYWFAMNLDPNGTSFWSAGIITHNFYRFNIASGAIELGPIDSGTFEIAGLVIRGEQGAPPVTPSCLGDGTGAPCPCANSGAAGHGCENSSSTGGALLTAAGSPSLGTDNFVLTSSGERSTSLSLFMQGDAFVGPKNYGDGLRCAGGMMKRLYVKNAVGGSVTAPLGGDASISARSAALGDTIVSGSTRYYQVTYRDPIRPYCPDPPGNTFNISNALTVVWGP